MRKNKKLFAILTLVAFMMTLMPVLAFGATTSLTGVSVAPSTTEAGKVVITVDNKDAHYAYKIGDSLVAEEDGTVDTSGGAFVELTALKTSVTVAEGKDILVYKLDKSPANDTVSAGAKVFTSVHRYSAETVAVIDAYEDFAAEDGATNANLVALDSALDAVTLMADFTDIETETGLTTVDQKQIADAVAAVGLCNGTTAPSSADNYDNFKKAFDGSAEKYLKAAYETAGKYDLAKQAADANSYPKAQLLFNGGTALSDATIAWTTLKGAINPSNYADFIDKYAKVDKALFNASVADAEKAAQVAAAKDYEAAYAILTGGSGSGSGSGQTSTGVSVDASIIATKDANASIEAEGSTKQDGKGGLVYTVVKDNGDRETKALLDTKYAEVELVLRQANNASFAGTDTVYVWAEESGKSRQATDALVIDKGGNKEDSAVTDPITDDSYNVYAIDVTGTETIKVAFLRAGTYTLKASIVDPTGAGAEKGLLASNVSTFKTVNNKNTVTATSLAQETRLFKVDVAAGKDATEISKNLGDGEKTTDSGANISNVIVSNKGYVSVNADTVATTKVAITVRNKSGNLMTTYPIRLSTSSANIELDETNVTTDYKGVAEFNVAGVREGEYKIYVNIGDYEGTIMVQVGATSANDIQLIKFPSNPIATDTLVDDYKDIFRFQLTDANGNIVTGHEPRGAKYASIASDGDKSTSEMAKYAYIVSAPEANKVKNADLKLAYVSGKDYYTLDIDNNKAFEAEGDYEVRVVLDNGKSATLNFSVKKFDKAVSLHIEYPTTAVELNSVTEAPDIYFLDANRVMKKANNRVTVAAQGYAVASVVENGDNAGVLKIKNDEKYIGQTITVTAASDKENLMASTTLTVADEAREVKLDTNRGPVNANNRVGFKVVDSTGAPVALGKDATVEVTAVVTNTGDQDAKVSYSVTASSRNDLKEKGTGIINLSSNKQTTATVQIMVKVTKNVTTIAQDNNTGLSTTYYSGTETFTFGAEADKSVVMTIGSKEIVAQNVPVTIDVAPFIQDNRTYVPFRALVEAFGAEVDYNADNNTVTTKLDGKTVVLTVGSTVLTVNDETVTMDVAPFIVDDRVVVPVRFVGEAFGFTVEATQDADTGATASVVFYQK